MKDTANGSARRNQRITAHLRRIQSQMAAIERSLNTDLDGSMLLQRIAAARGTMSSLMTYLIEDQLRLLQSDHVGGDAHDAIEEIIDVVHGHLT